MLGLKIYSVIYLLFSYSIGIYEGIKDRDFLYMFIMTITFIPIFMCILLA